VADRDATHQTGSQRRRPKHRTARLPGSNGTARHRIAYRRRADISRHRQPSTTGERQEIPRNLTKLGHRTGRSAPASVIWVNAGLPAAQTADRPAL